MTDCQGEIWLWVHRYTVSLCCIADKKKGGDSKTNYKFDIRLAPIKNAANLNQCVVAFFFFLLAAISAIALVVCLVKIHPSSRVRLSGFRGWGEGGGWGETIAVTWQVILNGWCGREGDAWAGRSVKHPCRLAATGLKPLILPHFNRALIGGERRGHWQRRKCRSPSRKT